MESTATESTATEATSVVTERASGAAILQVDGVKTAAEIAAEHEREDEVGRALASRHGLEFVDVRDFRIQNDLFRRVPFDLMLRYAFIPEEQHAGRMTVVPIDDATSDVMVESIQPRTSRLYVRCQTLRDPVLPITLN